MVAVVIYLMACWFIRPVKTDIRLDDLRRLANQLRLVRTRIRSGSIDWRPVDDLGELPAAIVDVIESAWLEGKPILQSIGSLERQLALGAKVAQDQFELRRLHWSRSGLVGLVALGIGLLSPNGRTLGSHLREQLVCGVLAAGVYLAGYLLLRSATAVPWVAIADAQNETVSTWLSTHIDGETTPTFGWARSVEELTTREFHQGVSLLAEKRSILEEWSEEQLRASKQRLALVADLMPIGEIFGLGLPLIIFLFQGFS